MPKEVILLSCRQITPSNKDNLQRATETWPGLYYLILMNCVNCISHISVCSRVLLSGMHDVLLDLFFLAGVQYVQSV